MGRRSLVITVCVRIAHRLLCVNFPLLVTKSYSRLCAKRAWTCTLPWHGDHCVWRAIIEQYAGSKPETIATRVFCSSFLCWQADTLVRLSSSI